MQQPPALCRLSSATNKIITPALTRHAKREGRRNIGGGAYWAGRTAARPFLALVTRPYLWPAHFFG